MDVSDGQEKLTFLLAGGSKCLPKSNIQLRSYLNVHSSNLAAQYGLKLPKFFTSKNISCPFCFTPWDQSKNSFKLLPSSGKKFKNDSPSNRGGECEVSTNSDSFHTRNKLVLKCHVCLRKSLFSLAKPKITKEEVKEEKEDDMMKKTKKKKKKKKNKLANLNGLACIAAGVKLNPPKNKEKKKNNNKNSVTPVVGKGSSTPSHTPLGNSGSKCKVNVSNNKTATSSPGGHNLVPNPFSPHIHKLNSKTNNKNIQNVNQKKKKLAALQRAMSAGRNESKSSLKDFLSVIKR